MFKELLKKLALFFENHNIPYIIIGGQAVLLYGEPRFTRDIDVTLGIDPDRLSDVMEIVEELSLKVLPDNPEQFVRETMVLPLLEEDTGIRVDMVFSFTPYEQQAIGRANKVAIEGIKVNFVSVEDLIVFKIFAGRPRDMEDVRSIILKNPNIDMTYIKNWLKEFNDTFPEGDFISKFNSIMQK